MVAGGVLMVRADSGAGCGVCPGITIAGSDKTPCSRQHGP